MSISANKKIIRLFTALAAAINYTPRQQTEVIGPVKKHPFEELKYFSYKEAHYLKRYITTIDSPGAKEIIKTLGGLDRAVGRLLSAIEKSGVYDLHERYVPDRMTLRYISAMADLIGTRMSIASDSILGSLPVYAHSDEAIRLHLEAPALTIWRKAQRKAAALGVRQLGLEKNATARIDKRRRSAKMKRTSRRDPPA
jgi:hypothetical protein